MNTNLHWFRDAALAAARRGEGRRPINVRLMLVTEGVCVSAAPLRSQIRPDPAPRESMLLVNWEQLATAQFNPLLTAIERASAAITDAEDESVRRWTGDPDEA